MSRPKKGERTPGSGRAKGTPNKATADVREALGTLAKANVSKVQAWLNRTAATDPARALELYLRLLEYHVPKLARTEISSAEGVQFVPMAIVVPRKEIPGVCAGSAAREIDTAKSRITVIPGKSRAA